MFWRFCRTKPFIDSYSTSRDRQSNASPLFLEHPLYQAFYGIFKNTQGPENQAEKRTLVDYSKTGRFANLN